MVQSLHNNGDVYISACYILLIYSMYLQGLLQVISHLMGMTPKRCAMFSFPDISDFRRLHLDGTVVGTYRVVSTSECSGDTAPRTCLLFALVYC